MLYGQNGAGYAQNGVESTGGGGGGDDLLTLAAAQRIPVGSSLHHWRLGASPYADSGSSPVAMTAVGSSWVAESPDLYTLFAGTQQTSPSSGDRLHATVADIPDGSDLTIGCTVAMRSRGSVPADGHVLFGIGDGVAYSGGSAGTFITLQSVSSGGAVFTSNALSGHNNNGSNVSIDWTRKHRFEITYVDSTRVVKLYIDGILVDTATISTGSIANVVEVFAGGYDVVGSGSTTLVFGDLKVDLSAISAADALTRYAQAARFF